MTTRQARIARKKCKKCDGYGRIEQFEDGPVDPCDSCFEEVVQSETKRVVGEMIRARRKRVAQ
jgi:hypothetical protein